ncbi:hypothetical protein LWI28_012320 [Acer negundo]|uniref:Uncharacterized protein n=1 Tax=Acer negundo TaxID=4023 RepID=A0AAD5NQE0_ACENE|nr:hypothetical protein LWI28_012320 [Acer negundo]
MFARVKLVPTTTERAERDTEGPSFEPSDTEGSDLDGRHIRLVRTRWVRFTLPREPRTRDDSRTGDDSRGGIGGQAENRRYTELMDALRELQEEVRKSNEKRDQQHQELLDLIRGLQGSTSHAPTQGTRFDDPPFDDKDGHRDFSPRGRTGSHQGDQQGPGVTPREEVTRGISGTDTTPMEIEEEPQQVLPNQPVHSQDLVQSTSLQHNPLVDPGVVHPFIYSTGTEIPSLSVPKELTPAGDRRRHSSNLQRAPTGDTGGHSPSTHRTSGGNTRGQSSSLQLTHPVDHIELDRITPPLQCQERVRRAGWHDVDLLEPVGVPWFHRFQTNIMELEDTSWLLNDWERLMGSGADKPRRSWSMFKHQWSADDLAVVRGLVPAGTKPWNEVDVALASVDLTTGSIYLMDPFRQEVPFRHRKTQLACLRYFLPSMLHALDFHGRRRRGDMTYTLQNKPFPLNIVSRDHVPQQDRGYNCLKI